MALSVYPHNIPRFVDHRNLLDDVDANDINSIQREIVAITQTLGSEPHIRNDVALPSDTFVDVPGDLGAVDTGGLDTFATQRRVYDSTTKVIDYGTVANRLDALEKGGMFNCFKLSTSGLTISPSANVNFATRPKGIRFPKASAANDPFGMYNGKGVTLRKSGFWVIQASIALNLQGSSANNAGTYLGTIDKDDTWIDGMDKQILAAGQQDPVLNPRISGFFPRGTRLTLRMAHNSNATHNIRLVRMTGFLVREDT